MLHEVAYERLRYPGVDAVHRYVVAVVCGPPKGELAEVARADDESAQFVGQVHQYLCALARLAVLVGHVVNAHVVAYVHEMPLHTGLDAYLARRHAQRLHERHGIVVGAVGGAEAGHGNADDAASVYLQPVEGPNAYEQGERGVEPAADAHHHLAALGVGQSLGEAQRLYVEHLVEGCLAVAALRHKGPRFDVAQQHEVAGLNGLGLHHRGTGRTRGVDKRGVGAALGAQPVYIDLSHQQLGLEREAVALAQ